MPTLTMPSSKDTFLRGNDAASNFGNMIMLFLFGNPGTINRSLLEFDISGLPVECVINSATLMLYYYSFAPPDPVGKITWAYKLTRTDWVELEATWNIYKAASNWTAGGGDYVIAGPVGGSVAIPAGYGWMSWNVLAIVQDAFDNTDPVEILVKYENEAGGSSDTRFHSNEYITDPSRRPKLVINYTVAPVGGGAGGITGAGQRLLVG